MRNRLTPILCLVLFSASAFCETISSGKWSSPTNWGGTLPANDGTASIITMGSTTMDTDWDIASLSWNSTASTDIRMPISGGNTTLTIRREMANAGSGRIYFYPNLVFPNDVQFVVSGNTTTLYGSISGVGGLVKSGVGKLVLDASNTFSGNLVINGGVVEATTSTALGQGDIAMNGGTMLIGRWGSEAAITGNVSLGSGGGVFRLNEGNVTFSGRISGNGQLRLDGERVNGNQELGRFYLSEHNTYSGGTLLGAAVLFVTGGDQVLGTGDIVVQDGGVLSLEAATNLAWGQKVQLQRGGVVVLAGDDLDPAELIDSNPQNTTGGVIALSGVFDRSLNLSEIGNGELFLGACGNASYTGATLGPGTGNVYRLGGGSTHVDSSPGTLIFEGIPNLFSGNASLVVGYPDAGVYSYASGRANIVLRESNNYTGGTTVVGGTLTLGKSGAIGSGNLTLGSVTLVVEDSAGMTYLPHPIKFAGSPHIFAPNGFALTGPIDLGGDRVINGKWGNVVTLANTVGNGTVKFASGNWILEGNNTFSGELSLYGGAVLHVSRDENLGMPGEPIKLGGTLRISASFSMERPINAYYSKATIFTEDNATLTLRGSVSGQVGLYKDGGGVLVFQNNSPSGSLHVNGGEVLLDNTLPETRMFLALSPGTSIRGNGYLQMIGSASGSKIAPGKQGVGTIAICQGGYLELGGNSSIDFDLGPTASDLIVLNGTMDRWSATIDPGPILINVADVGGLQPGQTYTLIDGSSGTFGYISIADFKLGDSPIGGRLQIENKKLQFVTLPLELDFTSSQGAAGLHAINGAPLGIDLLAAGGTGPYSWRIIDGALPAGVALGEGGGLTGSPSQSGNYSFTVQVADSTGARDSQTYSLTIADMPVEFPAEIKPSADRSLELSWPATIGAWYQVETSDDLVNWSPVGAAAAANSSRMSWADDGSQTGKHPSAVDRRFYRIRAWSTAP